MTDIKPGDYVRVAFEGPVVYVSPAGDWLSVELPIGVSSAHLDHCTVIDPPVRVGDEISYEQAKRLPNRSVIIGTRNSEPIHVVGGVLWYGPTSIARGWIDQTFRVLDIPTEATS